MGGNSETKPTKEKQKGKLNSVSPSSPWPAIWKDGRFYGGEDDCYWRLSFGEERFEGEKSRGGLKSVWYDSDDEIELPRSSCQNCKSIAEELAAGEEIWKLNDMVSDMGKMREMPRNLVISPCKGEKEGEGKEIKIQRGKAVNAQKSRKTNGRVLEDQKQEKLERDAQKAVEKEILEVEPVRIFQTTERENQKSRASNLRTIEEDYASEALNLEETSGFSKEQLMSKSVKQRKSVYVTRELQRRRRTKQRGEVRVYSPRTAAKIECRIKALEDIKKGKMMMMKKKKKKSKERTFEGRTVFDSFAVAKCSLDPQQDFRDSMLEMITEKAIREAEELEELLACYLTLNSDKYHDLIIKVFRQDKAESTPT
ncbi:hypothetical protein F0562_018163 [Nyssa sinensis]|uniref:Transcription repressor n=1 Tax=Nyssa sinensis TaxID=561372 RepID=A0A5J4Z9G0_9ASTE|nr:hypothetical protein F0562_018163 [Nyssa sinensis]